MEVNGYIIPPPIETEQCIKILKKHGQPQRCGGQTGKEDLKQAKRLILELTGHTDYSSTIKFPPLLRSQDPSNNDRSEVIFIRMRFEEMQTLHRQLREVCSHMFPPTHGEEVRRLS